MTSTTTSQSTYFCPICHTNHRMNDSSIGQEHWDRINSPAATSQQDQQISTPPPVESIDYSQGEDDSSEGAPAHRKVLYVSDDDPELALHSQEVKVVSTGDGNAEIDWSISPENRAVIDAVAEKQNRIPLEVQNNGLSYVYPDSELQEISGIKDYRPMAVPSSLEENMVLITQPPNSEAFYLRDMHEGVDINDYQGRVPEGARFAVLSQDSAGNTVHEYLGEMSQVTALSRSFRKFVSSGEGSPSGPEGSQPCDYCGQRHRQGSHIASYHAVLLAGRDSVLRSGPEAVLSKRRELEEMVLEDMDRQFREDPDLDSERRRVEQSERSDRQQAYDGEQRAENADRESHRKGEKKTWQNFGGGYAPYTFAAAKQAADQAFAEEHPDVSHEDPRSVPENPDSEKVYRTKWSAKSEDAYNPLWVQPEFSRKGGGVKTDLPAPEVPQNFGAVHVPSMIAAVGGFGSKAAKSGDYIFHGNPMLRAGRADRKQAVEAARDWMINQELWKRGLEPGSRSAKRWLKKNSDIVDHINGSLSDSMLASAKMKALYRHNPKKYAPGSPALRSAYSREMKRLAAKRGRSAGHKPISKVEFIGALTRNFRGGGMAGAGRFLRSYFRNRGRSAVRGMIGRGMYRMS